jgi:hypothetical protein
VPSSTVIPNLRNEIKFEAGGVGTFPDTPLGAWMVLENMRQFLTPDRWNPKGWFRYNGASSTMCLANGIRFVAGGKKGQPTEQASNTGVAARVEKLVLQSANALAKKGALDVGNNRTYSSIPNFNDTSGRTYEDVVKAVEGAIQAVRPAENVVHAGQIMTPSERRQMARASWEAELEARGETFDEWLADVRDRGWDFSPTTWLERWAQGEVFPMSGEATSKAA